jgi:hypothetical protein
MGLRSTIFRLCRRTAHAELTACTRSSGAEFGAAGLVCCNGLKPSDSLPRYMSSEQGSRTFGADLRDGGGRFMRSRV